MVTLVKPKLKCACFSASSSIENQENTMKATNEQLKKLTKKKNKEE